MVGETMPEGVSQRFSTYIEELREFFASREVRFGAPDDLAPFAELMRTDEAFADEMGSLLRSFLYREDEQLGRGEMLDMVLAAVGGPEFETRSEELQGVVRQIFISLNGAVRIRRAPAVEESEPDVEETLAPEPAAEVQAVEVAARPAAATGAVPATAKVPARPEAGDAIRTEGKRAVWSELEQAARPPVEQAARPEVSPLVRYEVSPEARPAVARARSARMEHLASEHQAQEDAELALAAAGDRPRHRWLVPALAGALALVGVAGYVARPMLSGSSLARGLVAATGQTGASALSSSCVAPMAGGVSQSGLEERSRWAHNLLDQKLYDAALPELREIARLDPGYPGIKLDESEALLNLKRADDAREAIDAQLGVSECLSKLPEPELNTYCSAQFAATAATSCRGELAHIRQAAELQAALVHLELGHRAEPDDGSAAAIKELTKESGALVHKGAAPAPTHARAEPQVRASRVEPLPPASDGDAARPPMPRPATTAKKPATGNDSLMRGEGTDSAYGAYQKPE